MELLLAHGLADRLQPLEALVAATALAHAIPLCAREIRPYRNITDLEVVLAYSEEEE